MPASATWGSAGPPRPIATTTGSSASPRREAGHLAADRGLAGALARADHGERRRVEGRAVDRRPQLEVGARVAHPAREGHGRELHALAVAEHRLVGEVEHDLGPPLVDRLGERGHAIGAGRGEPARPRRASTPGRSSRCRRRRGRPRRRGRARRRSRCPSASPAGSARRPRARSFASSRCRLLGNRDVDRGDAGPGRQSPTGTVRSCTGSSCSRWNWSPASEKWAMTWLSPNGKRRRMRTCPSSNSSTL